MNKFITSVFGLLESGVKSAGPIAARYGRGAVSRATVLAGSRHLSSTLKIQAAVAAVTFLGHGTPEEKLKSIGNQMLLFWMTAGMSSGWRQGLWQLGLQMAPHLPDAVRGSVQGFRGIMEARSMAHVPFSYSTLNTDQAFASMQYAQQRMGTMYGAVGTEAAFQAARVMQR